MSVIEQVNRYVSLAITKMCKRELVKRRSHEKRNKLSKIHKENYKREKQKSEKARIEKESKEQIVFK